MIDSALSFSYLSGGDQDWGIVATIYPEDCLDIDSTS